MSESPRVTLRSLAQRPFWWGQNVARRLAHDLQPGGLLLGVAGRQVGKTEVVTYIVLSDAMAQPGGESCVLVPTYRMGLVQAKRLRALGERIGATWAQQKGLLTLPNGHAVWLRSAEREDAARGLSISGWLWVDEATLVAENPYKFALGCMLAGSGRTMATCTPKGKQGWVWREWSNRAAEWVSRFRLRSKDSPLGSDLMRARVLAGMGASLGRQEMDAEFLDDGGTPFSAELVDAMMRVLAMRGRRMVVGVDLAKSKDYTVLVLMNEWREAWVIGRWRHVAWPVSWGRIEDVARKWEALLVVDESSGAGAATCDELEKRLGDSRVLRVRTALPKVKQQMIEELQADAQHDRLHVDSRSPFANDLRHELLFLTPRRVVKQGVEHVNYEAASDEDHDDTVMALGLANLGQRVLDGDGEGDLGEFARQDSGLIVPRAFGGVGGVGGPGNLTGAPAPGQPGGVTWGQAINGARRM